MVAPRESKLIKYVPADTAMFFSTVDIAETWDAVMASARDDIDKAIREEGEYDSLDEALREAGRELGINSLEDVIKLFQGETAVAVWFPERDEDNAEGLLIAEVDEAKATDLLKKMVNSNITVSRPRTETVANKEMTIFRDEVRDESAYAFLDGNLLLGTPAALRTVLEQKETPLSELRRYRDSVEQMPTALGTYGYFNLGTLLRLAEGGVPADLDEVEKALSGLIINVVDERGVVRLSGVLTIEE
jgi:hypothetical protein